MKPKSKKAGVSLLALLAAVALALAVYFRQADESIAAETALAAIGIVALVVESRRRRVAEASFSLVANVIESATDAIYSTDRRDVVTSWNRGAERLYGFTAAEVIGQRLDAVIARDWVEERAHLLHQVATSGHAETLETRRARRDGSAVDVSLLISPMHDAEGRFIGAVTVARDISQRKASEAALARSEARYQRISAHLPGMVFQLALRPGGALDFPLVSDGCRGICGLAPEEIMARPAQLLDMIHADDRAAFDASLAASAQSREPWHWEGRLVLRWGEEKWVECRSRPEALGDGSIVWDGVMLDATARRRAHEELAHQQEFLSALLENLHDGLIACDGSGNITLFNRAMRAFNGLSDEQSTIAPWLGTSGFFQADGVTRLAPRDFPLARATLGERVRGVELVLHPADGGEARTLLANGQPLRDLAGRHLGAVVALHDITDRKRAEMLLRRSHEELERCVAERTAQLLAAKQAAENANAAKDEFLSRMSHELRTPLNAILGFTQLLEMDELTGPQADSVGYISRAGGHLLRLVNDVLDLSCISSGRLSVSPELVALADVMWETLSMVQHLAADAGVRLPAADELREVEHWIFADPQRLRQVLLNLMTNAVKYNRSGGEVRIAITDADDDRVRIAIADTGIGIAPEKMERLFKPFERLGMEREGIEGTGIGLALSRRMVEAMGGALSVESQPGEGSTFAIEFPRAEAATTETPELVAVG